MSKVLIFHQALPPYRVDIFNSIGLYHEAKLVLLQRDLISQSFNQKHLTSKLKLPFSYLDKGFRILNKNFRFGVISEIKKFNPEVVVASEFSPTTLILLFARILKRDFKVVVWTDDNSTSIQSESLARYIVRKIATRFIDGLILASDSALEIYKSTEPQKRVIPILQNESEFRTGLSLSLNLARKRATGLALYGKKVLLFVGRLEQEKRVDLLIECFNNFLKQCPNCYLVIVGDGSKKQFLIYLAEQLGISKSIYFSGKCEGVDLLAWYSIGQLFFLLSEYEQFGAVVNEALISGIPTICSAAAGANTLIKDGANGYIVDASKKECIFNAFMKAIKTIQPLSEKSLIRIKDNLMLTSFNEASRSLCSMLDEVSKKDN